MFVCRGVSMFGMVEITKFRAEHTVVRMPILYIASYLHISSVTYLSANTMLSKKPHIP